ncbi:DNA double-strand break repair nuclease NurA [Calorimonas adulescens]|uniref:DNA double-strand break repair nuclease NurA n=1 Tax=Calorimonas adulescens TaxID=2606906 RepID=A0A5D8QEQ6_9THEO|nr:DNA double-strand break repair nuclease NurA [Calorimonas adulescens]TZE82897.1 DNA double-strand break repair nuclease NurA [Calorimonas adulescens]
MENGLKEKLKTINSILREKRNSKPPRKAIREAVERNLGKIIMKAPEEKPYWIRDMLVVDGSFNSYGSTFPYIINFFRSLALFSLGNERIFLNDIYIPLLDMESYQDGDSEEVLKVIRDRKMAEMEIRSAIEGVKRFRPSLVVFDGGFLRYEDKAKDAFDEYRKLSREAGTLSVGVIEEIGTFDMARKLRDGLGYPVEDDRELLFGVLEPCEILEVRDEMQFKRGFYTVFARPSMHPNPVAYDFFEEDRDRALEVVRFLISLTPAESRGIPLILDIVDGEVKIGSDEVEALVDSFLDKDIKEGLFRPQRDRRFGL